MSTIKIYSILFWMFCISAFAAGFPYGYYLDAQQLKMANGITGIIFLIMIIGTIMRKQFYARLVAFTLALATIILAIVFLIILIGPSETAVRTYISCPIILLVNLFIIRFLLGKGYKAYIDNTDTYETSESTNDSG